MKKLLLIIPILIAVILVVWSMQISVRPGGGMLSVTLSNKVSAKDIVLSEELIKEAALDEYIDSELIKLSDTQYEIYYEGTESKIEIGSVDKEIIDFKPDITVKHWNDEVSFSLIAPSTIDSKSELTADLFTDKVIATNGEWNFEYFATDPNDFNEYGGIDMIITAKEKPASNKIYFTYDSTTVTPYYQGELTAKEIEEGSYRPDHVVGSIAFYANGKGNHAIGGINYATGKVGHLYAMRTGEEWCRWSIEGDYIVLTIPDIVFNGKYPVVISPVGDTFGYTSIGGSTVQSHGYVWICNYNNTTDGAGTGDSISVYILDASPYGNSKGKLYATDGNGVTNGETNEGTSTSASQWRVMNFGTSPSLSSATDYWIAVQNDTSSSYCYLDSGSSGDAKYKSQAYGAFPDPISPSDWTYILSIYCTYTPSAGDPDISVLPVSYDFGVVAESTTPYTATDYFTITNNSAMQTDQTISVTAATWSGGVTWTHSDTATAGSDTAGLLSNRGGTWGSGDVIVKYSSPNYIYENCPASTGYDFGLKLMSPTAFSDGVEKEIVVRITATAD